MTTKKFMGANQMIDRLTAQVGGNREMAIGIMQKRGQLKPGTEEFTPAGAARNRMTAAERAVDRASRTSGKAQGAYQYDPNTNRATLKRKK